MQTHKQWSVSTAERAMRYIKERDRIKFRMLEVRENKIALRKLSGGAVQLRSCTL